MKFAIAAARGQPAAVGRKSNEFERQTLSGKRQQRSARGDIPKLHDLLVAAPGDEPTAIRGKRRYLSSDNRTISRRVTSQEVG